VSCGTNVAAVVSALVDVNEDTLVSLGEWLEIERAVKTGGMGAIYRAKVRASGEPIALKLLQEQQPAAAARFQREARVLAQLHHPAIVRYIAHGSTRTGRAFLAMEWLDGEDLSTRLSRTGLTPAESVRLVSRVAEALAVAHARGIVHRDLKPSNLFLVNGSVDQVKILDFGVARLAHGSMVTRTGAVLGTPAYMAPEQARGDHEIDGRADIFALGCVLFKCLTGRPPFSAGHPVAIMGQIIFQEAPHLRDSRPELPVALDELLARMLAKDPSQRPATAAALATELERLGGLPGEAATECERRSSRALTDTERRLLCAVLIAEAIPGSRGGPTLDERARPTIDDVALAATYNEQTNRHDIAAVRAMLDQVSEVVGVHGGHASPLADGSVVAVFAGDGSASDLATRAASCALALRSVLPDSPIALATGREVLSGSLPVGEVLDRQVVLLDDRDSTITSTGDRFAVRLDDVTAGLLDARFDVAGDARGLQLFGRRDFAEAPRLLLGKPSICLGRERELSLLEEIFEECTEEPVARSVLITAAAGVGKSRLRHEFMRRLDEHEEPLEIWIAQAAPTRGAQPLELLARAMRNGLGLRAEDAPAVQRRKLRARVSRHFDGEARTHVTACLGAMLGVPFDEDPCLLPPRGDASRDDLLRNAFEDFVRAECETQPVVLVLEDVHWGDTATVKHVDAVLRVARDLPLFVLATARLEVHERFPGIWFDRGVEEVRLHALRRSTCSKLVKEVLGAETPREIVKRIVAHSGGNAFFLEELMRAHAAGRGQELPATVLAMVHSRLERFPAEARRVLRAASVFGGRFTDAGLLALLDGDPELASRLPAWLELLEEQEVVARTRRSVAGADEYMFLHAYMREAAYAMLTDDDRALAERLVAEWLAGADRNVA